MQVKGSLAAVLGARSGGGVADVGTLGGRVMEAPFGLGEERVATSLLLNRKRSDWRYTTGAQAL